MLYHGGFSAFRGGYVGVDVFFVISGYLITSILLSDIRLGQFSLVRFYERRARRILPALYLVLAVCMPLAWLVLLRSELVSFSKSFAAISLFCSNLFFKRDGGYFETASDLKPLLHTWSLAVEEQFYLVYPLFLWFAWQRGKRWATVLLSIAGVGSLAVAQWAVIHRPVAAFFLAPFRAWELAIGALAAFVWAEKRSVVLPSTLRQVLSVAGLILILVSVFVFSETTLFPGLYALVPTVGTSLVILFATPDTLVGSLLCGRVFVGIGLISYSAYLWHQPLFAFARSYFADPSDTMMLVLGVLALILAGLSWRFVERPFRTRDRVSRASIFALSGIGCIVLLTAGLASARLLTTSIAANDYESRLARALTKHRAIYPFNMNDRKFIRSRIECENLNPETIVVGSSRIMQIGEQNMRGSVLNLAVNSASEEDDIAIANLAVTKFRPKRLLIGADPWLFNGDSGLTQWKSIEREYNEAITVIRSSGDTTVARSQSREMDRAEERSLDLYDEINQARLFSDSVAPEIKGKILRDGSRVYDTVFAARGQAEIERGFDHLLKWAMTPYSFSRKLSDDFEAFVKHYRDRCQVVLVLAPYHPQLYDRMKQQRVYLDAESGFRDLAERTSVQIIGSYDPRRVGCEAYDFYDGMHPKPACMGRMVLPF